MKIKNIYRIIIWSYEDIYKILWENVIKMESYREILVKY